jgi:Raf kinase inhibitor-like YbhB/YbcL family protein
MSTRAVAITAVVALAACVVRFPFAPSTAAAQQAHPDAFTITLPGFSEAAFLTVKNAANDPGCGGENISPAVQWTNPPAGTRSFAVTVIDPDAQKGLGSVHWIAYGIPSTIMTLPEGTGTSSSKDVVAGANSQGKATYRGACPPVGDQPHHYIISVYALDLEPGALEPGLDRDRFFSAIKGHNLNATSMVLRYGR